MCDDCDDAFDDEPVLAPGTVWRGVSSYRLDWTDAGIVVADALAGLGDVVSGIGTYIATALRSHANYTSTRRAFGARVLEDIETL